MSTTLTTSRRMEIAEEHRQRTEENARKLGALESDVTGLKGDVGQMRMDMRSGFSEVFTKIDQVRAPKATPWAAVAVCLTVLMALAAWANSWVSRSIEGAQGAAANADQRARESSNRNDFISEKLMAQQLRDAEDRGATGEWKRWMETTRPPGSVVPPRSP